MAGAKALKRLGWCVDTFLLGTCSPVNWHLWDVLASWIVDTRIAVCRCTLSHQCRVSPVKAMTIPRLELMGAVLSSRLAQNILKVISVDRTIFWTDSENVWYWIRNQSREFKPFAAMPLWSLTQTDSQASSVWLMWQDGFSDSWPTADFQWIYKERIESSCRPRYQKQRRSGLSKPKPSLVEKTKGRWSNWTLRLMVMG